MEVQNLRTVYQYGARTLDVPQQGMSPDEVRNFYAGMYPELINAEVLGPDVKGDKLVYEFKRNVGTKG